MPEHQHNIIVDIPEERIKFFGTSGKMLLPTPEIIANLLEQIPERTLTTTGLIRKHLAAQFNVEAVCPVTTQKALKSVASNTTYDAPYWRVINQNGGLVAGFPKGQAEQLQQEGLSIDTSGKRPAVNNYQDNLHRFT